MSGKSDHAHVFCYWLISEINYNINITQLLEHYYRSTYYICKYNPNKMRI